MKAKATILPFRRVKEEAKLDPPLRLCLHCRGAGRTERGRCPRCSGLRLEPPGIGDPGWRSYWLRRAAEQEREDRR